MESTSNQSTCHPDANPWGGGVDESKKEEDQNLRKGPVPENESDRPFDHYKMDHKERGHALIINNRFFEIRREKLPERQGTDVDLKRVLATLTDLGFKKTTRKFNATVREMKEFIIDFAAKDYADSDCFVCVILTYGTRDGFLYGKDGKIKLSELIEPLKGRQFQSQNLVGKPKIFFIHACQPGSLNSTETDAIGDTVVPVTHNKQIVRIPTEADFLIAYSCVPGSLSPSRGSSFIVSLKEVLKENHQTEDLLSMLTKVNQKLSEEFKIVPCIKSMLRKKILFSTTPDQ